MASEPTAQLLRRLDTRAVVITPEDELTIAPILAGFDSKLRKDGKFAVSFKAEAASVEQVLAAVRAAGVRIKDLSTEEPDLEDVFLALTYGDASEPDPTKEAVPA